MSHYCYNILEIKGPRRSGKSKLLAHYIKDLLAMGKTVLLTGDSLYMIKSLEEREGFKATLTTTSERIDKTFDYLAIEEAGLRLDLDEYLERYGFNFTEGVVYTTNLEK
jgi:predicted AAA+ superfamily ATPase